ncbi:GNAT family N-acetyltransferase [candidate division KSB1 bacterium]|nr:GNAT family N-acetyltransferase [candidate division KSB1 bacterium]RQW07792.1 MAG: GNAT family N-acetyltransferase [candidate division KSB1 bacterium]
MMEPIVQLTAGDYENAIDFLNLVFSVHYPIDFPRVLPKLYKPTDDCMSMNYAIKRHGKIRAIVGLYPIELHVGAIPLKLAAIGAVSSHPNDRAHGYMQRLLRFCLKVMRAEGYHLSWLGGQRQRYGYFGYEVCGSTAVLTVNKKNISHCYTEAPAVHFDKVGAPDERVSQMKLWHDQKPIHCSRPVASFVEISRSWQHDLFAALSASGELAGYVIANAAGAVFEMVTSNEKAVIPAWVTQQAQDQVVFETAMLANPIVTELTRICEQPSVRSSGNWQIFDWQRVVDGVLKLKHQSMQLMKDTFRLGIDGYGVVELKVDDCAAECVRTQKRAHFSCDPRTAMRLLFGPLPPAMSGLLDHSTLNSWCPLPLSLPRPDEV